jgi:hypothetical protein
MKSNYVYISSSTRNAKWEHSGHLLDDESYWDEVLMADEDEEEVFETPDEEVETR